MEHFIMAFTPTSFIGARRVRNWSLSFATLVLLFANPTQLLSQNSAANAPSSSANAAKGGERFRKCRDFSFSCNHRELPTSGLVAFQWGIPPPAGRSYGVRICRRCGRWFPFEPPTSQLDRDRVRFAQFLRSGSGFTRLGHRLEPCHSLDQ